MATTRAPAAHPSEDAERAVRHTFWIILLSRLALNMQMRVIYPFLPAISRGLGVPLGTTSLLLTARAAANLSSPLYGALADRLGRRPLMLAGLVILATGTLLVAFAPTFGWVLIAVAFLSLCKAVYDPAVLAYLGDTVPYQRRARLMGLLALMWPAAWLLGVPASGLLIQLLGWRAPFVVIGLLGMLSLILTWHHRSIGAASGPSHERGPWPGASLWPGLRAQVAAVPRRAWPAVLITLLLIFSAENVYVVYGAWLEAAFGLSLAALGAVSVVISLAEFAAEGASAGFVDRIGKRRAVAGGLALTMVAYLLLPRLAGHLGGALAGLFLVYLTYDFSIVSSLPLLSELAPRARGTLLSVNVAAMALGRLASSLTAVRLWDAGGLAANTLVSALAVMLALTTLLLFVRERRFERLPAAA
jgi:predicted MFS family arabinose efflux permease